MTRTWMRASCCATAATIALVFAAHSAVAANPPAPTTGPATDLQLPPDFFPILPWDAQHGWNEPFFDREDGLQGIADCGFTVAGFVQPKDLPLCEKLGLKAIMAPPAGPGYNAWTGPWRSLTDEQVDQRIRDMVEQAGDSKSVIGYFLTDEPGTPLFPKLGRAVAAVRKYAPGKLAYINLFPSYATLGAPDASQLGANSFTEYLEKYVEQVKPQFISYDNYMVQYSGDLRNAAAASSYYRDLLEIRRVAFKHGLPFWNIVSAGQIQPGTPPPSPANLLFQVYTTLAAGGRGVSWYCYYSNSFENKRGYDYTPSDHEGRRNRTWGYLQMVHRQLRTIGPIMNRLTSTGVYFTAPPPAAGLPLLPGRVVQEVQSRLAQQAAADPALPTMVGEFTSPDGGDYVMVVNLSLERSAYTTLRTTRQYTREEVILADDGKRAPLDDKHGLWLAAGQGALIEFK